MSIRIKGVVVVVAIVAGVAAAGYAAAPWLLANAARYGLAGTVEFSELDIESVDWSTIEVAAVRASLPSLKVEAHEAVVRFDPWPFRILEVTVRDARIQTSVGASEGDVGTVPPLPPYPLSVGELSLKLATPWGDVALPLSVASRPGTAGGLMAEVQGPDFTATLTNSGDSRHLLEIDAAGNRLLSVNARTNGTLPVRLKGRLEPGPLGRWLRNSPLVPSDLRPLLRPYTLSGGTLQFDGTAQENLDLNLDLRGALAVHDGREAPARLFDHIELRAPSGYTIRRESGAWSGSGAAAFRFAPDPDTTFAASNPGWRWDAAGVSLEATAARLDPLGLEAATLVAGASLSEAAGADGSLRAAGLKVDGWPDRLALYDVSGNWSWGESSIDARGDGSGTGLPDLEWELHSAGTAGYLELRVRDEAAAIQPSLATYTAAVAPDLAVRAGSLSGAFRSEWDEGGGKTTLQVDVEGLDADLGGMQIRNLRAHAGNQKAAITPLAVALSAPTLMLAAGTVAEDVEIKLELSPPDVRVDTARMRLFGGGISLRPVSFAVDEERIILFADIDAVSLQQVMALLELETTELTGEVAGPVRIVIDTNRGISIDKGDLHSLEPGVLRLRLGQDSDMAARLNNIALQALADFQYEELNASLLYQPDGAYRITARILGRNPAVLDGHPIALNPTIEGRLPALFRAFLFTGDFNRAIIERLQEQRDTSTSGETSTLPED